MASSTVSSPGSGGRVGPAGSTCRDRLLGVCAPTRYCANGGLGPVRGELKRKGVATAFQASGCELLDVQADVEDGGGVREGADGDQVHTRRGEVADRLQRDAPGDLEEGPPGSRRRQRDTPD